ncbi:MAG: CBS domain-containing protein [Acidimicrobiales bacterium]|nr:CBS domain-containing protein [Acidimicrobiales bacterium]MCB9373530.1 CBS domain-containing protein [Microthrixaceae bacterium]
MPDAPADQPLSDLVQRGAVTIPPSATLRDAAVVMAREEVGVVVVVSDGRAAGVLSERDVVRAVAEGDDVDDGRAGDVMAMELVTASVDDRVADAAEGMLAGNIRHLPVVDGDKVVGVVSIRDVLAAYRGG